MNWNILFGVMIRFCDIEKKWFFVYNYSIMDFDIGLSSLSTQYSCSAVVYIHSFEYKTNITNVSTLRYKSNFYSWDRCIAPKVLFSILARNIIEKCGFWIDLNQQFHSNFKNQNGLENFNGFCWFCFYFDWWLLYRSILLNL